MAVLSMNMNMMIVCLVLSGADVPDEVRHQPRHEVLQGEQPHLRVETRVVAPHARLQQPAHVLHVRAAAALLSHEGVGEGELGDGEPGAVGEQLQPGGGQPGVLDSSSKS